MIRGRPRDCRRALTWLAAEPDGELSGRTAAELARHLVVCPECRGRQATLAAARAALAALPVPAPRPGFDARLAARLAEERGRDAAGLRVPRLGPLFASLAGVAVAAVIVMLSLAPARPTARTDQAPPPPLAAARTHEDGAGEIRPPAVRKVPVGSSGRLAVPVLDRVGRTGPSRVTL